MHLQGISVLLTEEISHHVLFSKHCVNTLRMQWHSRPPNPISQCYPIEPLPFPVCELFQELPLLTTSKGVIYVLWLSDRSRFCYTAHRARVVVSLLYNILGVMTGTELYHLPVLEQRFFLYMDCSEHHFTYEISLVEPSCTLFVETAQDISRNL